MASIAELHVCGCLPSGMVRGFGVTQGSDFRPVRWFFQIASLTTVCQWHAYTFSCVSLVTELENVRDLTLRIFGGLEVAQGFVLQLNLMGRSSRSCGKTLTTYVA